MASLLDPHTWKRSKYAAFRNNRASSALHTTDRTEPSPTVPDLFASPGHSDSLASSHKVREPSSMSKAESRVRRPLPTGPSRYRRANTIGAPSDTSDPAASQTPTSGRKSTSVRDSYENRNLGGARRFSQKTASTDDDGLTGQQRRGPDGVNTILLSATTVADGEDVLPQLGIAARVTPEPVKRHVTPQGHHDVGGPSSIVGGRMRVTTGDRNLVEQWKKELSGTVGGAQAKRGETAAPSAHSVSFDQSSSSGAQGFAAVPETVNRKDFVGTIPFKRQKRGPVVVGSSATATPSLVPTVTVDKAETYDNVSQSDRSATVPSSPRIGSSSRHRRDRSSDSVCSNSSAGTTGTGSQMDADTHLILEKARYLRDLAKKRMTELEQLHAARRVSDASVQSSNAPSSVCDMPEMLPVKNLIQQDFHRAADLSRRQTLSPPFSL